MELRTSAVLGANISAADCTADQRTFLDTAMMYGRAVASSNVFLNCLDGRSRGAVTLGGVSGTASGAQTVGPYRQCIGDPFFASDIAIQIAKATAIARSPNDVLINCSGGGGNASAAIGVYGHDDAETLSFSQWLADNTPYAIRPVCDGSNAPSCTPQNWAWPFSQAAGIIWHEAAHTQQYTHGANDQMNAISACGYSGDQTWNFQNNTMPYIIGSCVENILDQSATTCNGVTGCPAGQVKLIDGINASTCSCVQDPRFLRIVLLAATD